MNYHNSICRLSAPIQFHSKINEQLLGRNQRQCAVTPGPLWVSGTLKDQPLAVARQRGRQEGCAGGKYHIQRFQKGTNVHQNCGCRFWQGRFYMSAVIMESMCDACVYCQFIIQTESSSHISWTVIGEESCVVAELSWATLPLGGGYHS